MDCLHITGGIPLSGAVSAAGSKNAALPIMAACILAGEPVTLRRVPSLADVDTLSLLLGHLGVAVKRSLDGVLQIHTVDPSPIRAEYRLVRRMRASFCVLGPLLARRGRAVVSLPGGCNIGSRPVDLHLRGLAALGAEMHVERGYIVAAARRLRGAHVDLAGPHGPTVTGTANVMSAAVLARGRTLITSAAHEPEIADLGRFLNRLGARISGLGTDAIEIDGVEQLGGCDHTVIADRIESATLLLAAAITGGAVQVEQTMPAHLTAVLDVLAGAGCHVTATGSRIALRGPQRPRPFHVVARPYPGVPTDLQAQLVALAALADGRSTVSDAVFPERFMHVAELCRLGARIERLGATATICGATRLGGGAVTACDLRASAALVLAALRAQGPSTVHRAQHLERGYDGLDGKLAQLGAQIQRVRRSERARPELAPWARVRSARRRAPR